ncbi:hypothetical protein BDQ17DRAFT_948586 [Cyathus striatus]|nr:hypothetical protein BDQ17DRAFT_948586 [Cyathus striatus]
MTAGSMCIVQGPTGDGDGFTVELRSWNDAHPELCYITSSNTTLYFPHESPRDLDLRVTLPSSFKRNRTEMRRRTLCFTTSSTQWIRYERCAVFFRIVLFGWLFECLFDHLAVSRCRYTLVSLFSFPVLRVRIRASPRSSFPSPRLYSHPYVSYSHCIFNFHVSFSSPYISLLCLCTYVTYHSSETLHLSRNLL